MKFVQSLIAASAIAYGAKAEGFATLLDLFGTGFFSDGTF